MAYDEGIPDASDNDALEANALSAFELDGISIGWMESAAGDADRDLVQLFEPAFRQVQRAGTFLLQIGIAAFVKTVSGDALRGASQAGADWSDDSFIASHVANDHTLARRLADHRPALRYLAGVPREALGHAAHNRDSCKEGRVAAPSCDHEINSRADRLLQRLYPHHADNPRGAVDCSGVHLGRRVERYDAPAAEKFVEIRFGLLGAYHRNFERPAVFADDLADDFHHPVDVDIGARGADRADQDRDLSLTRRAQHDCEIALHRVARERRPAASERERTCVGRARVSCDEMRPLAQGLLHTAFVDTAAERADRGNESDFIHCVSQPA